MFLYNHIWSFVNLALKKLICRVMILQVGIFVDNIGRIKPSCPRKYIKETKQTYVCEMEEEHFYMTNTSQVRCVDPINREQSEPELQVNYCIWEGCIEAKWIEIEGVYLVNPNFINLFKERHKQID